MQRAAPDGGGGMDAVARGRGSQVRAASASWRVLSLHCGCHAQSMACFKLPSASTRLHALQNYANRPPSYRRQTRFLRLQFACPLKRIAPSSQRRAYSSLLRLRSLGVRWWDHKRLHSYLYSGCDDDGDDEDPQLDGGKAGVSNLHHHHHGLPHAPRQELHQVLPPLPLPSLRGLSH